MALDAGWAGVIGAAIGALGTIGGSWLSYNLQNRRAENLAEKRKNRLRIMLSGNKYTWRGIDTLAASIGADEETTKALLIEIDARASFTNSKTWALESRAPWPEHLQPEK